MIHRYKQGGYNIVLDVNSGAIHVMDELGYDLVGEFDAPMAEKCPEEIISKYSASYTREEIEETYGELYSLYKKGELYDNDDYENKYFQEFIHGLFSLYF